MKKMATKVAREQIFKNPMLFYIKLTGLSDAPLGFKIRRVSFLISKVSFKKSYLSSRFLNFSQDSRIGAV